MDKNLPVGFFDSGVGGLSVYARFKELMPFENTLYFGDLKNLPYGNKTREELIGYAENILNFFDKKGVKAVVIACNTSSAMAYEYIKNKYSFKIYPIIQSCAKVIAEMPVNKIGVFATVGTVKSSAYKQEILKYNPNLEILEIACPKWVSLVEGKDNDFDDIRVKIDEMIQSMQTSSLNLSKNILTPPDKIILGCTHYPYLMNYLTKLLPEEIFIDPAKIFAKYIYEDLSNSGLLNKNGGREEFFVSAAPESFVENARIFYDVKSIPVVVSKELCSSF